MRIAAFCFFAPAAFSLGLRRWLLGKESTGEALLHFGTAALWLNALALALLDARFHVEVPVVQALSQSGLFALKYLALTCALALVGVLAERLLARAQAAFRLPEWLARTAWLWAALLAAVLFGLHFARIFDNNFWGDEGFSIRLARQTIPEMLESTAEDVHPPLYYLILMGFNRLLGNHGWVYHLASVVPFGLTLAAAVTFLRREFGWWPGALLCLFSSFLLCAQKYDLEVRMYSWAALFVLLAFYELYRLLTKGAQNRDCAGFVLASLAAAYCHYYALVTVAFLYVGLLAGVLCKLVPFKKLAAVYLTTVAGYLPWFVVLLTTFRRTTEDYWMTKTPTLRQCLEFLFDSGSGTAIYFCLLLFVTAVGMALTRETGLARRPDEKKAVGLNGTSLWILTGLAAVFGTMAVGLAVSALIRPMFATKYLYPAAVIVWLLFGVCLSRMRWGTLLSVLLAAVVVAVGVPDYQDKVESAKEQNERYRQVLAGMADLTPADGILTDMYYLEWTSLEYYFPENEHDDFDRSEPPELEEGRTYWLLLSGDLDEGLESWLAAEGRTAREVCHDGRLATYTVHVYQCPAAG